MAEMKSFEGLSDEDLAVILRIQDGDDETDEERRKREEFQRQAEKLNEEYLAQMIRSSETSAVIEHKWSVEEDAGIARALQESSVLTTSEVDAEYARHLEHLQLVEDAVQTKLRTTQEEEFTRAVLHESPINIPVWDGLLLYTCPHCGGRIVTLQSEIACTIFTHGVTTAGQVNQHLSESQAAAIAASGVVKAGCMKQYKLVAKGDKYDAVVCSGL